MNWNSTRTLFPCIAKKGHEGIYKNKQTNKQNPVGDKLVTTVYIPLKLKSPKEGEKASMAQIKSSFLAAAAPAAPKGCVGFTVGTGWDTG